MWKKTLSKTYKNISKEAIWRVWKDINNYTQWHNDLEACQLNGEFTIGNYFTLKPKNGPRVKVWLTEINDNEGFSDCTHFFGAKMYDIHKLEETPEGLKITNTIIVKGFLTFLWVRLVAKDVAANSSSEMDAAVELARNYND